MAHAVFGNGEESTHLEVSLGFKFLHDRVRQAAYSLLHGNERPALHLRIGRLLLVELPLMRDFQLITTLPPDEYAQLLVDREEELQRSPTTVAASTSISTASDVRRSSPPRDDDVQMVEKEGSTLIDVVNHLNRGQALIIDADERRKYAQLNCLAALNMKDSTAFRPALTHVLYGQLFLGAAVSHSIRLSSIYFCFEAHTCVVDIVGYDSVILTIFQSMRHQINRRPTLHHLLQRPMLMQLTLNWIPNHHQQLQLHPHQQ
jgi:hypothetical protein